MVGAVAVGALSLGAAASPVRPPGYVRSATPVTHRGTGRFNCANADQGPDPDREGRRPHQPPACPKLKAAEAKAATRPGSTRDGPPASRSGSPGWRAPPLKAPPDQGRRQAIEAKCHVAASPTS